MADNKKSNIKLKNFLDFAKLDQGVKTKVVANRLSEEAKKVNEDALLEKITASLSTIAGKDLKEEFKDTFFKPKPVVEVVEQQQKVIEQPIEIVEEVKPHIIDIQEIGRQPEPELPVNNIIDRSVVALSVIPQKDIQQVADSIPNSIQKELDILKKSVADFHRFAQRHSQLGGGGAGSVDQLTFHTVAINNPVYNATRRDYYLGVNYAGLVTINLPTQNLNPGRQIVVKDESGNAALNNITITTLDGSTIDSIGSFVILNSFEAISLIYANGGWKII